MTISSRSIPRIEYRDGETGTLCIAEPGRVFVHGYQMKSLAELEEFITTLRQAASEAQLPPVKAAEPKDKDFAKLEELLKKAKGEK
jgi:hypothetical protein